MFHLEIKKSGGKLLPHSVLRGGGGGFPEEVYRIFAHGGTVKKLRVP
jgi:hypothetical protein